MKQTPLACIMHITSVTCQVTMLSGNAVTVRSYMFAHNACLCVLLCSTAQLHSTVQNHSHSMAQDHIMAQGHSHSNNTCLH